MDVVTLQTIYANHKKTWDSRKQELATYKALYELDWHPDMHSAGYARGSRSPVQQVAEAKVAIDRLLSNLFTRHPSVTVAEDIVVGPSDGEIAKVIANRWLYSQETAFTEATKIASIYPGGFVKIVPVETTSTNPLDQFRVQGLMPYEVIVDAAAKTWETQRWVGHTYYIPFVQAQELYPKVSFRTENTTDFFDTTISSTNRSDDDAQIPKEYQFVLIVELFDLIAKKVLFFSPSAPMQEAILDERDIPTSGKDGTPIVPIYPIFFESRADKPLEGISVLKAIVDPVLAKNQLRTAMLDHVARDVQVLLVRKGSIPGDTLSKIERAKTKTMVVVDLPAEQEFGDVFSELPAAQFHADYLSFEQILNADLARAFNLGPFVGGEITGATAEEIATARAYSQSTMGRMARVKDLAIENIVSSYLRIIAILVGASEEDLIIRVGAETVKVLPEHLEGNYRLAAQDSGFVPETVAMKLQQFMSIYPLLAQQPGANIPALLSYLGKLTDLPDVLTTPIQTQPTPQPEEV